MTGERQENRNESEYRYLVMFLCVMWCSHFQLLFEVFKCCVL